MILSKKDLNQKTYHRIISLVPSQTELLSYLGLEEEVVGITKFCIHPDKWYRDKTRIGGTKNINLKTVNRLCPDLIIANKEENTKEQVTALAEKYDVWVSDVNDLGEAVKMIEDIGNLTGKAESAFKLVRGIQDGFKKLGNEYKPKPKIRTAYFIWKDPYMVVGGGTFINDMMARCGLKNVFAGQSRYPQITLDELKEKKPEMILLSSEPYPFKEKHREAIQKYFPELQIKLMDGEMFSWYGSRLLKSIDYFHSFLNI